MWKNIYWGGHTNGWKNREKVICRVKGRNAVLLQGSFKKKKKLKGTLVLRDLNLPRKKNLFSVLILL